MFTRGLEKDIPEVEKRTNLIIKDLIVTEEMVTKEIMQLNTNKSCGPGEIHPRLLIEVADIISSPLGILIIKTQKDGNMPQEWKKANVSPIYKNGARNRAEKYRPISQTSIVCKIMELLIKEAVMHHILSNISLSPKQYGFISGRSTVTQLLRYLNSCRNHNGWRCNGYNLPRFCESIRYCTALKIDW